jgi:predicted DsbA family dithiol-disulfide isomerase
MTLSTGSSSHTIMHVFLDPSCPWTWITSRWLVAVTPGRDLELRWRSFSLAIRDGGALSSQIPEQYREAARIQRVTSRRALQLFELIRAKQGESAVGRFYEALGFLLFQPDRPPTPPSDDVVQRALVAAGLDARLEVEADDPAWDREVRRSMEEAYAVGGKDAQSPTLVIEGSPRRGISGPTLSAVPEGEAALRLWDAVRVVIDEPAVCELSRPRPLPPQFPPPPVNAATAR